MNSKQPYCKYVPNITYKILKEEHHMTDNTQYGDIFTLRSDANMNEILQHLSSDYVLDCMNFEIETFKDAPFSVSREPSNIVKAFETEFKTYYQQYPTDAANISANRTEIYYYIIDTFKNCFGLDINVSDNPDYNYILALHLYDLLIVHMNRYILEFFGKYIINNIDDLCMALDLVSIGKGNVDSSLTKLYNNPKVAYVIAYTYAIVSYMASFDITLHDIIDSASIDAETKNLLNTNIVDDGSFFKTYIGSRINDAVYVSELISSLRIYIAKNCQIRQPSIDDYIKRKQEV